MLLLLAPIAAAHAADPFARASVDAQGTIYPGQQVTVTVDVLVPNFFMSPPQFPLFDLPNAVVTLPDSGAENLNETVDGESFAGIRRSYLVTPQAAGDYVLPPVEITFTYAAVPGQASPGKVTLPPTRFTVTAQPGAETDGASVTAARVDVEQALDRDAKAMKAGDTLVRTVTVTADGMQAMMIPEPSFEAPEGVRIYRHDPKLEDQRTPRGEFVAGRRTDTVTYVFEKAGNYSLPAVEVHWFDPQSGKAETASAPAVAVTVAEAAASNPAIAPPAPVEKPQPAWTRIDWRRWLPVAGFAVAVLAAAGWLLLSGLPRLLTHLRARRAERENSEPAYFRRFEQACRGRDARAVHARLDAWARRCEIGPVAEWLRRNGDDDARRAYATFEKSVFGGADGAALDLRGLGTGLARTRHALLAKQQRRAGHIQALPPLNPRWADNSGG
ncbi:hypothetical protein RB623_21315 [Mesorhizobium sp. LHD-90]|uniref:hypothetical protein n=1 Tax=Mesorhizobium sp. LHD-90 TaxID=3071414 RepID=UPI0027E1447B|nr:hypothetical protein [Mesorhizobium sp. LHD-90]MDQ6436598.1 hypothetical protein [Mesorhizobium sp. LHD-90]